MWGWFLDSQWKVTLPWWRRVDAWFKGLFDYDVDADVIAQAYDINFWRANLVDWNSKNYDTWSISKLILDRYDCQWNTDNDKPQCWMPVVVEYDK